MKRFAKSSTVLTVRVDSDLGRALELEARRRGRTKSELARELLVAGLGSGGRANLLAEEARRQSLLVSRRRSEREALDFLEVAADTRSWD